MEASLALLCLLCVGAPADRGNPPTHLDERSPFGVGPAFPRLTTPMWFGEDGVDAAVILSIDDMRDPEKYRVFLEPILAKLVEIEGRSPLSIFSNTIDPTHPQLARWLASGVRLDVHTLTHPCPLLGSGFEKASSEVLDCTSLIAAVPGGRPAAFRMPCCDSINSASPRFFSEILPRRSSRGDYLEADSSVLVFVEPSHRAYAPFSNYAATADGYPYPYVVGRHIWEFPIIAPSDWQAQKRHGPTSPATIADLQAILDRIVDLKGLYTLCFHPHGWIRNDQVVGLVDHAARRHGRRVRFLSFHDAIERLGRNVLGGASLRENDGSDAGVRLLDVDADGYMDAIIARDDRRETRIWDPRAARWRSTSFPFLIADRRDDGAIAETGVRFAVLHADGRAWAFLADGRTSAAAHFDGDGWKAHVPSPLESLRVAGEPVLTSREGRDAGVRFRDLDGDGYSDLLVSNERQNAAFRWSPERRSFEPLPWALPRPASIVDARGADRGLRFLDADNDGRIDVVLSNEDEFYFRLHDGPDRGWATSVVEGKATDPAALPEITRRGEDRGAWIRDGVLYIANEDTASKPDLVEIRSLGELARAARARP